MKIKPSANDSERAAAMLTDEDFQRCLKDYRSAIMQSFCSCVSFEEDQD